jgi:hypothetical protein
VVKKLASLFCGIATTYSLGANPIATAITGLCETENASAADSQLRATPKSGRYRLR